MNTHAEIVFKVSYTTETAMSVSGIWLLVELVRSRVFSLHRRGFFTASLCEDFSDLTSPTNNYDYISVVNNTF